jgi:hypothetical protein
MILQLVLGIDVITHIDSGSDTVVCVYGSMQ